MRYSLSIYSSAWQARRDVIEIMLYRNMDMAGGISAASEHALFMSLIDSTN